MSRTSTGSNGEPAAPDGVRAARLSQRLSGNQRDGRRDARGRPRTASSSRAWCCVEVERRRNEGRLVKLGPREYELRPRLAKTGSSHSSVRPSTS